MSKQTKYSELSARIRDAYPTAPGDQSDSLSLAFAMT